MAVPPCWKSKPDSHHPCRKTRYTWPLAMQGRDVIGVAATGSGKTLAFLPLGAELELENGGELIETY